MKQYEVYTHYIAPVRIEAEKVITYSEGNKPIKIKFLVKEYTVAEFYSGHIAGWKELKEDE